MPSITLTNATLLHLDPIAVCEGAVRIEDEIITAAGPGVSPESADETLDCRGAVVMPGLVNGHTHLYSALATGMPPPSPPPTNFLEILQRVWWRLDRALDAESVAMSGRIGAMDALHCGTTTLIDHHASPSAIAGSLDQIEAGVAEVGLRAVLCYEVTDRNGPAGTEAGLAENRRYLDKCKHRGGNRFAALVGAHAAFTLCDASLEACVKLAVEFETGMHIHVAEDPADDAICRADHGAPLVRRLEACGLLPSGESDDALTSKRTAAASILGHGTQLAPADVRQISSRIAGLAHNPRSNMNNAVGYAPVAHAANVLLGTDGIGGDLFAEARHAWFKARDAANATAPSAAGGEAPHVVTPDRVVEMLARSARIAGARLGVSLGRLASGAAADLVVTDYRPATPLTGDNASAHLIFSMDARHVRHVLIGGQWALKDRRATHVDESTLRAESVPIARAMWSRMARYA